MEIIYNNEKINIPDIDNKMRCFDNDIVIYNCVLNDDNTITGYTEEGKKAKFSIKSKKWLYGKDIKLDNLIDLGSRNIEDRKYISSLGGTTTAQRNREKKTINEIAKQLLDSSMSKNQVLDALGEEAMQLLEGDFRVSKVVMVKAIQETLAGSFKWGEFLRDTAGYKPKNEVQLEADIMTDADRQLIDNISQRIG